MLLFLHLQAQNTPWEDPDFPANVIGAPIFSSRFCLNLCFVCLTVLRSHAQSSCNQEEQLVLILSQFLIQTFLSGKNTCGLGQKRWQMSRNHSCLLVI